MAVSTDRRGITGRDGGPRVGPFLIATSTDAARASWQPAPRDRPVKALSPSCRGGSITGRRQTAATPHAPPSENAAGNRPEPVRAQPPHSYEELTSFWPAMHPPDGAGIGTRSSPGFGKVSGSAPRPALAPFLLPSDDQDVAKATLRTAPPSANSHTEPLRTTHRLNQVQNTLQHPKIAASHLPPGGPGPHPRARFARPLLGPCFRHKDSQ